MSDLKPCPFCGGEAELTGFDAPEFWVWCPNCKASTDAHTCKGGAIAAWNTRADTATLYEDGFYLHGRKFVPERTCHDRNASAKEHGAYLFMWRCSNCDESYETEMDKLNYCPNCGAKVVGE